ncbi:hypothetical protein M427DRAFT_349162 [Gonapodya prolifera JEL478]|uniref:Uncharacterized protein n=1 Tax=Gonapodya prolifera (strain JEL478) TaxID=1344416 RepID=A0A139AW26_GONPJ|nr:hypothetical protein M427DRAFT_349162 [Gonapodya prolifera JEL478]|eukprot:KXS20942.1 hypothetical protein M427DRAFT_349162 [Gonapodya prolifera JEL478]
MFADFLATNGTQIMPRASSADDLLVSVPAIMPKELKMSTSETVEVVRVVRWCDAGEKSLMSARCWNEARMLLLDASSFDFNSSLRSLKQLATGRSRKTPIAVIGARMM